MPAWFQKLSVVGVFIIEMGFPLFIFGPRLLRYVAFSGFALLLFLIAAAENYNFFNLLALILAFTLLDDRIWPPFLRRRISAADSSLLRAPARWRILLVLPIAELAALLGGLQVKDSGAPAETSKPSLESKLGIAHFCLVNDYGLPS